MRYLCNAFSLNMLPGHGEWTLAVRSLDAAEAREAAADAVSVVGHASTAAIFATVLARQVEFSRATVALEKGDTLVVGQYVGPRLEEGTMTLPEGAKIEWRLVSVN